MAGDELIRGKHWLEPCLPMDGKETPAMQTGAEQMIRKSARLSALASPITMKRIGRLLTVTNSYYTNLIEGVHIEPSALEIINKPAQDTERAPEDLRQLGVQHMVAQAAFERLLSISIKQGLPWKEMVSPKLVSGIHGRLFHDASIKELTLSDGTLMVPGQLRSESGIEVNVGNHLAPASDSVGSMLSRLQEVYGRQQSTTKRIISAMACHHRMAFIHPFPDGNGRAVRLLTHLQLAYLDLASPIWSLSRGLAKNKEEYYRLLAAADQQRHGDLDGRGQLTHKGLCDFIEFMIKVCLDQMTYIEDALDFDSLDERINQAIVLSNKLKSIGVKPEYGPALKALFKEGKMDRAVFKRFLGVSDRLASSALSKMIMAGVVVAESPKSRQIEVGLPLWYANYIFPELHHRFNVI